MNSVHASAANSASSSNVIQTLRLIVDAAAKQPCVLKARCTYADVLSAVHCLTVCSWRLHPVAVRVSELTAAVFPGRVPIAAYRVECTRSIPTWAVAQRLESTGCWLPQYELDGSLTVLLLDGTMSVSGSSGLVASARCDGKNLIVDGGTWGMVPQLMPIIDPCTVYCNNTISTQMASYVYILPTHL